MENIPEPQSGKTGHSTFQENTLGNHKRKKKMTKQLLFSFAIWSCLIPQNTHYTKSPPLQIQFYMFLPQEIPTTPRNNYRSATSGES